MVSYSRPRQDLGELGNAIFSTHKAKTQATQRVSEAFQRSEEEKQQAKTHKFRFGRLDNNEHISNLDVLSKK